jgi:hypothetical protein
MGVGMGTDRPTKGLRHSHHAGTRPRATDGFSHQLLDGLISKPSHVDGITHRRLASTVGDGDVVDPLLGLSVFAEATLDDLDAIPGFTEGNTDS